MTERDDQWPVELSSLLRRIRRSADCSQRELARRLDISATAVAQAETGARDLPSSVLARAARLAGLRLALVDARGRPVAGMAPAPVRDRAGRRFPAHLDPRHGDVWWWHGSDRHSRSRPPFTFDRGRTERDDRRATDGTPPDHPRPRPGDSLELRASLRRTLARVVQDEQQAERAAERARSGISPRAAPDPVCTCPPGCAELLFTEDPLPPRLQAVPHLVECTCRCDIA